MGGKCRVTFMTFFFSKSTGRSEGLFRIAYAIVLLIDLLFQRNKWELLYSNQGLPVGTPIDNLYAPSIVNAFYFVWIAVLLLLVLGVLTRWTSILNYALLYYFFILRGVFVGHGADWVFHSMGFYLMFMTSDRCFCLWHHWFPPQRKRHWGDTDFVWPLRLAQINFVFIYFSAGVAKLFDPVWLDGSALELTLAHPFLAYPTASWMELSPLFLAGLTYLTTVWQLAFPLALFSRPLRVFFVLSALIFHVFIAFTMRVGWFSEIMIASSLLFWDDFAYYFRRGQQPGEGVEDVMEKEAVVARPRTRNFLIAFLFLKEAVVARPRTRNFLIAVLFLKEAVVARPRTRNFLIVFLFLFAVTQIYFISVAAGGPIHLLRRPAEWMARITGNRPYDLVPSKYVRRVQFVVFEVVDQGGKKGLLYPFKANGELDFGPADVKEIRRGLARVRLASGRASPVIWTNFINQDIVPQVHAGDWQYPVQINIYRIDIPIADVERPFNVLNVPKQLVSRVSLSQKDSRVQLPPPPARRLQGQSK